MLCLTHSNRQPFVPESLGEIQTYTGETIFFFFSVQVFYLRTRHYCKHFANFQNRRIIFRHSQPECFEKVLFARKLL